MNKRIKIPIRTYSSADSKREPSADKSAVTEAAPSGLDREVMSLADSSISKERAKSDGRRAPSNGQHPVSDATLASVPDVRESDEETLEMWRDRAQRLQAEMENFRKRQRRLADERAAADRERLLRAFLHVADDLERALNADGTDIGGLRQGVNLTYQSMMDLLNREGVEPIQAQGKPFDPAWHEAVSVVPHQQVGVEPNTVVEVVQPGYRLDDRLLRPARVIVAT